jgi:hypothetical protein
VLRAFCRRLVPEAEEDPRIRKQIAEIIADAEVPERDQREIVMALLDALQKYDQFSSEERDQAPVRDAILVALGKHLSQLPNEKGVEVIRVAIVRARDDYKLSDGEDTEGKPVELPPSVEEAIRYLEGLLSRSADAPA